MSAATTTGAPEIGSPVRSYSFRMSKRTDYTVRTVTEHRTRARTARKPKSETPFVVARAASFPSRHGARRRPPGAPRGGARGASDRERRAAGCALVSSRRAASKRTRRDLDDRRPRLMNEVPPRPAPPPRVVVAARQRRLRSARDEADAVVMAYRARREAAYQRALAEVRTSSDLFARRRRIDCMSTRRSLPSARFIPLRPLRSFPLASQRARDATAAAARVDAETEKAIADATSAARAKKGRVVAMLASRALRACTERETAYSDFAFCIEQASLSTRGARARRDERTRARCYSIRARIFYHTLLIATFSYTCETVARVSDASRAALNIHHRAGRTNAVLRPAPACTTVISTAVATDGRQYVAAANPPIIPPPHRAEGGRASSIDSIESRRLRSPPPASHPPKKNVPPL